MSINRLIILFSLLFLLTGCPVYPICVTATDTSAKHLSLKISEGRNCELDGSQVLIITFALIDKKKNPMLWMIKSSLEKPFPSKGNQLSDFLYGVTPKGFSGEPAKQLHPGDLIRIEVDGVASNGYLDIKVTK